MPDKHYVLMHKNYEVLTFRMNEDNEIIKVDEVLAKNHIPLNMQLAANQEIALYEFISNRSIPKERKIYRTYYVCMMPMMRLTFLCNRTKLAFPIIIG